MGGEGGGRQIGQYQVILDTSCMLHAFIHSCICSLLYKTLKCIVGSVHSLIDANQFGVDECLKMPNRNQIYSIQFHSIQFNSCLLICLNYNRHIEASHWSPTLDIESSPEPIINLTEVKGPEMEEEEEEDNIEG